MGAWGIGPFENDGALDLLAEIRTGSFRFEGIEWAFEDEDYLEVDGGQIAIALAELALAIKRGKPAPTTDVDLASISEHFTSENIEFIRTQLTRALSDGHHSEIYELWEETEDFGPWLEASKATLEQLEG